MNLDGVPDPDDPGEPDEVAGAQVAFDESAQRATHRRAPARVLPRVTVVLSLVELVDRLVNISDPLPTGLPTLDSACRGGFRRGRRVIVGGAPSAGKTTLVVGWALKWARAGAHVVVLAADECATDLLVRLGQMVGLDRDAIEARDRDTLDRLRDEMRSIATLLILDADDGATVESAIGILQRRPDDSPGVLIIDSLQTARASGCEDADSPRTRVDAVIAAVRRASKEGLIVVATSELARGAYRTRDAATRIDDLAAGKESGGIEYGAQTLLVLRSVRGRNGETDVAIAKNRGGGQKPFRIGIDLERALASEMVMPANDVPALADWRPAAMERVRELLRATPGLSATALVEQLHKRGQSAREVIREMIAAGEIREEPGTRRLYIAQPVPPRPDLSGTIDSETRPTPSRPL